MEVYLDNAATTRVCPEAADIAYKTMLETYGNPSSTHTKGREAKAVLDNARKQLAAALDCAPGEVYFTSCGSEGDNWAIINGAESMRRKGLHIISSEVEHDAVRKSMDELKRRGFEVTMLKPESDGSISPEAVAAALRPDTVLVSLMMVNNETGAVTDIAAVAKALKKAKSIALLHTDAVQGFMKVPFSAKRLGADMITVSGHKIHAPKGIGALYIKTGVKIKPYIIGGAQESGLRAGTEAMPQIAAFGKACELAKASMNDATERMAQLRQYAAGRIVAEMPEAVIIGGGAPHILSVSLPGWRSEVLMNFLEARSVFVSRSSACKKGGRSHVLEAMGLPAEVIDGAVRISLSRYTTKDELDELCSALKDAHDTLAHR
ncbi:MAG: cysteine desulfurase family protein [Firmicutes bacterium]|nr:cysteine desulfurase [Bacillota bacterium]MDD6829984.1 cysteine desulfurase family protein [Bacillota bacterium]MDY5881670.1 cysteine desulfurase family protein [Oscillospiraceae bacterium]